MNPSPGHRLGRIAALACAAVVSPLVGAQHPVYRSATTLVSVSVSVKHGNATVANLSTKDFVLTDNGVPQAVEAVSIESVPIDVTLFLDTSGSTAGTLDDMREDVQAIARMLQSGDRFRLLTIGDSVYATVPWVSAGTTVEVTLRPVAGISLVNDALMFGLLHRAGPGRRHLIVGMTDRKDCGSVVPAGLLHELAGRSDAVMHLVGYSGSAATAAERIRSCTPIARHDGESLIVQAAERTGGELHKRLHLFRPWSIARVFQSILGDFRQSYVLRYAPSGVPSRGWHAIVVQVPGVRNATIRARQGYYGG